MALNATALYTTEPVAQQVARKAAGEELTKFANIFRAEVGKDQYTDLSLPVVPRRLREASGSHRVPGLFHEIIGLLLEDVEKAELPVTR